MVAGAQDAPDDRDRVAQPGRAAERGLGPLHGPPARAAHTHVQEAARKGIIMKIGSSRRATPCQKPKGTSVPCCDT